jgi:hypothetical protein
LSSGDESNDDEIRVATASQVPTPATAVTFCFSQLSCAVWDDVPLVTFGSVNKPPDDADLLVVSFSRADADAFCKLNRIASAAAAEAAVVGRSPSGRV